MDLKNFPMDVQTCIMQLESCESWSFSSKKLPLYMGARMAAHIQAALYFWAPNQIPQLLQREWREGEKASEALVSSVEHQGGWGQIWLQKPYHNLWEGCYQVVIWPKEEIIKRNKLGSALASTTILCTVVFGMSLKSQMCPLSLYIG